MLAATADKHDVHPVEPGGGLEREIIALAGNQIPHAGDDAGVLGQAQFPACLAAIHRTEQLGVDAVAQHRDALCRHAHSDQRGSSAAETAITAGGLSIA